MENSSNEEEDLIEVRNQAKNELENPLDHMIIPYPFLSYYTFFFFDTCLYVYNMTPDLSKGLDWRLTHSVTLALDVPKQKWVLSDRVNCPLLLLSLEYWNKCAFEVPSYYTFYSRHAHGLAYHPAARGKKPSV